MGFSPQAVNEMSMWQFRAAFDGYQTHHTGGDQKLSGADADELWEWLQSKE
jgi:hypothetical protein